MKKVNRFLNRFLGFAVLLVTFQALLSPNAYAVAISNVTFSDTNITYETGSIPNGTTVSFTIDGPGLMTIAVNCGIQNFGDTGVNIANLSQTYAGPGSSTNQIFWNGLWLIGGLPGRTVTTCEFALSFSTNGFTATANPSTLVTLNSIDIHSLFVASSVDSNGTATAPYAISYALAKSAKVSMAITNSSGTVVRTLLNNALQVPETVVSTHTINWDGLADSGQPVPLGIYTATISATDPAVSNSSAIPRTQTISVQSLAGAGQNAQKLFEDNAFVYPNPVRNGQGIFQMESIRDGATISLKIYTITGTLVRSESFSGLQAGNINSFTWDTTNQAGNKVGRGLYYYVLREQDPQGTLQVVKKMAVIP